MGFESYPGRTRELLAESFATLFVGVYDHAERTLTYVNCTRSEPGLLWRSNG